MKILTLAGSTRQQAYNRSLALALGTGLRAAGAETTDIDLADYDAPLYNGDLEASEGLPASIKRLKTTLLAHDGYVIATPEYNGFMSPLLINTIDWATRSDNASLDLGCFRDKPILVASASPGGGGGSRAATHLKTMLSGIGGLVFPDTVSLPGAHAIFGEDGAVSDEKITARINAAAERFAAFVARNSG